MQRGVREMNYDHRQEKRYEINKQKNAHESWSLRMRVNNQGAYSAYFINSQQRSEIIHNDTSNRWEIVTL